MTSKTTLTASPELLLPADPRSARDARRFLEAHLEDSGRLETAQLLVSELVGNAVLHARTAICVRVHHDDSRLRVEVTDQSGVRPWPRSHSLEASTGRGLKLLSAMSDDWGTSLSEDGRHKTVWFELR